MSPAGHWHTGAYGYGEGQGLAPRAGIGQSYGGRPTMVQGMGMSSGASKRISDPIAIAASARIYSTALPKIINMRNGTYNGSQRDARNAALQLIYAGRIQGKVL